MALTWDLTKINDYNNVCWDKNDDGDGTLNAYTEALIWLTMAVGIGNITEANADEFYARVSCYENLFEPMVSSYDENSKRTKMFITPEVVYKHIGLHTNVGKESDTAWRKRTLETFAREAKNKYRIKTKELIDEQ